MKKRRLILILGIFAAVFAVAQEKVTMSGQIRDLETGEDLIGATLYVEELGTGAVTNVYGFYSLTVPRGSYTVKVSYIGYDPLVWAVELDGDQRRNLELKATAQKLEEVTITAEGLNSNVSKNEMSTIRLSAETIKSIPAALGEPDLVKSILLLPGVTTVGDGTSGFNVRGGSADQNLILLDEGVIYNASHVLGFFSTFNPDAVKDVKIYKGGIPAQFGGRLSSVLDVRQKEGNMKAFAGQGAVSLISARGLVEGPLIKDRASFMVAARRSYADAFLAFIDNSNTAYFYDLNLKTNYILNDKNRLYLSGYFGRDKFQLAGILGNNWGNASGTFRWNTVINSQLFANLSVIYSDYDYAIDNLVNGSEYRLSSNILTWNPKADLTYFINDKQELEFGIDSKWYTFKPGSVRPIEGSNVNSFDLDDKYANEQGAYLSYKLNFNRIRLNAGLRYSRFARTGRQDVPVYENDQPVRFNAALSRYEPGAVVGVRTYQSNGNLATFQNWEPRFSATFLIDEQQSFKLSYNRMNQYLHLISNSTAPSPLDIWAPSGPYIDPQRADQYALGFFKNMGGNAWETSVEVYYKDMNNLVDYVDGADILANNQIETVLLSGDGRSYGAEFYVKKNTGRLTGWLSYTLSKSQRRVRGLGEGDPGINAGEWYHANFDKVHDLSVTGVYQLNKRWDLAANFLYASGLPGTYPQGRYTYAGVVLPHYGERNQERLPDYHRLDLSATLKARKSPGKSAEWSFGVLNVYNRANATSIYFRENEDIRGNTEAVKSYLYGITPNISYSVKF